MSASDIETKNLIARYLAATAAAVRAVPPVPCCRRRLQAEILTLMPLSPVAPPPAAARRANIYSRDRAARHPSCSRVGFGCSSTSVSLSPPPPPPPPPGYKGLGDKGRVSSAPVTFSLLHSLDLCSEQASDQLFTKHH
ncbi:hypothetical protein JYU34_013190 [Plutella xylostella]|uniref:Uncharacterized protein n=1 Tax=Plutella xylostella TaxID=51655 RepID=A0ABQ7QD41_PLUXY|nr:hypothetical protein JYU34_013190 [Plutella xylostella]